MTAKYKVGGISDLERRLRRYERLESEAGDTLGSRLDEWERAEAAERDYANCQSALNDERTCHQQTVTSLKNAASEMLKSRNELLKAAERELSTLKSAMEAARGELPAIAKDFMAGTVNAHSWVVDSKAYSQLRQSATAAIASRDLRIKEQDHVRNEFCDAMTNALQWIKNVVGGVSTPSAALAGIISDWEHCKAVINEARASTGEGEKV